MTAMTIADLCRMRQIWSIIGMVGGGARIGARNAWIIEQRLRHLEQQRAG